MALFQNAACVGSERGFNFLNVGLSWGYEDIDARHALVLVPERILIISDPIYACYFDSWYKSTYLDLNLGTEKRM